ncbi:unnamed protein product [Ixodes pacificus]
MDTLCLESAKVACQLNSSSACQQKWITSVNELLRCWLYLRSDCDEDPHDEDPHDCRLLKIAFRNDCSAEDCTAYEQWGSFAVIFFSFLRVDL